MLPLRFGVALLIAILARPASACLNDSEIHHAESEFRAHYAVASSPEPSSRALPPLAIALAGMMGAGGLAWWWRGRRG